MPALLKCENCQGKVSSEAAKKMDGKVVCPRCVSALRKAAEIRKLAEKKVKEQRAKAAAAERAASAAAPAAPPAAAGAPAAPATPAPPVVPAKAGSSSRLAGSVRKPSKSSSRVRAAARAAELLGADPEAAALVRSGRFIAVFARIQAVLILLGASGALAGGSAVSVIAGLAQGGSILAMVVGIAGSLVAGALLALTGVAFWRAGSWITRAGALLARLAETAAEDDDAISPASVGAQPRIIMPGAVRGN